MDMDTITINEYDLELIPIWDYDALKDKLDHFIWAINFNAESEDMDAFEKVKVLTEWTELMNMYIAEWERTHPGRTVRWRQNT